MDTPSFFRRFVARVVAVSLVLTQTAQVVQATTLNLATKPLAVETTATVRPNIMYVLDDSGSMGWDYTPDYINDSTTSADPGSAGGSAGDGALATVSGGAVTAINPDGSPPSYSHTYIRAPQVVIQGQTGTGASAVANYNASTRKISSISVTAGGSGYATPPFVALVGGLSNPTWGMCWGTTSNNAGGVPRDTTVAPTCTSTAQPPFSAGAVNYQFYDPAIRYEAPLRANSTRYSNANPVSAWTNGFAGTGSTNLTANWTHEVWCTTATPSPAPSSANIATHTQCKENLDTSNNTLYPDATHTYRKTYSGAAAYYVMDPSEYCTDDTMSNCQRSTTATSSGGVVFNVPAKYRWCAYYNPQTHAYGECQARRDQGHYVPNYLGGWVSNSGTAGAQALASFAIDPTTTGNLNAMGTALAGKSLTSITIGGIEVLGSTVTAGAADTAITVAQTVCGAIQGNAAATGFSCAPSATNVVTLQATSAGTWANSKGVIATGPADTSPANATAEFAVLDATSGYEISQITVNGNNLLSSNVTANGDLGSTAKLICEGINSGPNTGLYVATSGVSGSTNWGVCGTDVQARVRIQRLLQDDVDNGMRVTISGPSGTATQGTLTVSSVGGATRIADIMRNPGSGAVSILAATAPNITYADGTLTTSIATDLKNRINAYTPTSGCSATSSSNVVTITGCAGTLVVVGAATAATGVFRVTSTSSSDPGDLGGIQVNTANLVGHVTSAQITNGTAVAANAATLTGLINGGGSGFTATSAVNGSNYDITVTAPTGNSYNNQSFSFLSGSASAGGAGSAPQWTFRVSNATADNAQITAATCGGTDTITRNTASTGSGAGLGYIYNLAVGTYGLNGRSYNGYSYSCTTPTAGTPTSHCTISKAGTPACSNFDAPSVDAGITLTTPSRTQSGGSGTRPQWTFEITGASADNAQVSAVTCGSDQVIGISANTGSGTSYASVLAAAIEAQGENGNGNWSGTAAAHTCSAASSTALNCELCRRSGTGYRCSGNTATVTTSAGLGKSAVTEAYVNRGGSDRYCYSFSITGADTTSETVSVACSGDTAVSNASTGSTTLGSADITRINNLARNNGSNDLESADANGYDISCTDATTGAPKSVCTVDGPTGAAKCSTMTFTNDASITIANQIRTNAGSGSGNSTWEFDITGATTANAEINRLRCNGTATIDESTGVQDPTTGTSGSTAYGRINNLTQGASGLNGLGANGYTYSCTTATAGSVFSDCTVTGPVGAAACNTADFTIYKAASITTGSVTRTAGGSSTSTATADFAPALSQVSAFTGGYAQQTVTPTGITSTTFNPIGTDAASAASALMGGGSASSPNAIRTNTAGTAGFSLVMSGGTDADASTNHWTGVGRFRRIDLVSTNNTYNRTSGRTDCVGATCTYNEEIQNFANWYSYYKTRMLMMKSATTLAFSQLDSRYRVGFDNICQSTGTTVDRPVLDFYDDAGTGITNRTQWWTNLTNATPSCATPLRTETAKIGKYFSGKLTASGDPIQYSCQQNFMLLVTDGYWNENEPASTAIAGDTSKAASDIANADNNSATAPRPYYDGQQASTTCPGTGSGRGATNSSCRTLADIAWYYYSTDLRQTAFSNKCNAGLSNTCADGGLNDVSKNNVLTTDDDQNQAQHMSFYAMGLGIDGTLAFRPDYLTAGTGDFAEIKAGTRNWPAVANLDPTGVDDLWHATVNGRGKYFSARNPPSVVAGLREALNKIGARVGSAAAAATSNLEPVAGDNFAYVASYATNGWVGDLQSRSINLSTGAVSGDTNCGQSGSGCQWSARDKLQNQTWSARRIYIKPSSGATGDSLRPFIYGDLTGGEAAFFNPSSLSQYAALSVSNASDITAANLVDYLRGNSGLEQDGDLTHAQIWRRRTFVLGDIVDTQPVFMKKPSFSYLDAGYASFKTGTASSRRPVVFVSAQDGMLHAINADTAAVTMNGAPVASGEELWAFMPSDAMQSVKVLADVNYAHRFFVDGQITIGDVNFGASDSDWHTILVAGQGSGGSSYFALDVTDPLSPKFLWEFSHSGLGKSISPAVISKLPGGEWAVLFTSGYNSADGEGLLFALNPSTGALKSGFPISNGSGTGASPSNLGKLAVWADEPQRNNTAQYVYAGDTNGDLWRFDLNHLAAGHSGTQVFKLAHLEDNGYAQPITTRPELTSIEDGTRLVFVGTGKYLETRDIDSTDADFDNVQSFYGLKDTLGGANLSGASQTTWNPKTDTKTINGVVQPAFQQRKLIATKSDGTPITAVVNGQTVNYRQICSGASSTVSPAGTCANESGGNVSTAVTIGATAPHTLAGLPAAFMNVVAVGDEITVSGFTDAANTGIFTVSAIDGATSSITVDQTLVTETAGSSVSVSINKIDWGSFGGWFVDLPETGERVNVDMNLTLGTLTFASNIPAADSCTRAGRSWVNYVNYKTGLAVPKTDRRISVALPTSLVVGLTIIKLPSGALSAIVTTSDYKQVNISPSFTPATFSARRSLWREYEVY